MVKTPNNLENNWKLSKKDDFQTFEHRQKMRIFDGQNGYFCPSNGHFCPSVFMKVVFNRPKMNYLQMWKRRRRSRPIKIDDKSFVSAI